MQVTQITARFMRRTQVVAFEPAEAEISVTVSFDEGEYNPGTSAQLLIEVKEDVMAGLRHKTGANPAPVRPDVAEVVEHQAAQVEVGGGSDPLPTNTDNVVDCTQPDAAVREPGKPAPGRSRRTKAEMAEDASLPDGGDPLADSPAPTLVYPGAPASPPAGGDPLADVVDTPEGFVVGFPDTSAVETVSMDDFDVPQTVAITDAELLRTATEGQQVITTSAIRGILAGFGCRLGDLDADQRVAFTQKVNDAIAAAKT